MYIKRWATSSSSTILEGEKKQKKKIRIHTRREKNLLEPVNTRYLLLVGGFWETGGWPAPPGTHHKKCRPFASLFYTRDRKKEEKRRRRDRKVSCRWWHWFPRVVEPTDRRGPGVQFRRNRRRRRKEAPISDQPAPVDVIIGNTPIIPFTAPHKENKRKIINRKK